MIIKKGTKIYRGSSNEPSQAKIGNRPAFLRNLPVYFAENWNRASTYGQVTRYVLTDEVQLLNMSDPDVIQVLYNSTRSDTVKKAIKKAFRLANNGTMKRFSRMKYDMHVAQLICKHGFDGYYAPELKNAKTTQGRFPSEIVLCHPKEVLRVDKVYQPHAPPRSEKGLTNSLMKQIYMTEYI
jgi:hypothetical protein